MTLQGKGFFIYSLSGCEGGDPPALIAAAKDAGLTHVIIKVADGTKPCGLDLQAQDTIFPIVQALLEAGIEVWGWQYVYGNDPVEEAGVAVQRVQSLGLKGFVIHAEKEYELPGREDCSRQFMAVLRKKVNIPVALSSYAFPNFHPGFPWKGFLESCDYHMPRVFWEQDHNASEQLLESYRQCEALPEAKIYVPTGAAYRASGWAPLPADISDFLKTVSNLDLPAVNFYHWEHCRKYLSQDWAAISEFFWESPVSISDDARTISQERIPLLTDTFAVEFIASINSRQPARIAALYDPAAARIWANETLYGMLAIRDGYAALLSDLPGEVAFNLVQAYIVNDVHFLNWKAGEMKGETTLVLKNGKIIQDLTYIKE